VWYNANSSWPSNKTVTGSNYVVFQMTGKRITPSLCFALHVLAIRRVDVLDRYQLSHSVSCSVNKL
jgi:hypothetical protein